MNKSSKVEIRQEQDGDYGSILRVYIDGVAQDPFVIAKDKKAKETVLKATIAVLALQIEGMKKEVTALQEFKNTFIKLCSLAKIPRMIQNSFRL